MGMNVEALHGELEHNPVNIFHIICNVVH